MVEEDITDLTNNRSSPSLFTKIFSYFVLPIFIFTFSLYQINSNKIVNPTSDLRKEVKLRPLEDNQLYDCISRYIRSIVEETMIHNTQFGLWVPFL
jgi:hypothetical protein